MNTFEFNDISDQQDSDIENLDFGISDSIVLSLAKEIIKQPSLIIVSYHDIIQTVIGMDSVAGFKTECPIDYFGSAATGLLSQITEACDLPLRNVIFFFSPHKQAKRELSINHFRGFTDALSQLSKENSVIWGLNFVEDDDDKVEIICIVGYKK